MAMMQQKPKSKTTPKGPRRTTSGMWVDEDKFRPPFDVTYPDDKPKVKAKVKPKAKNGTSLGMKSVKSGFDKNSGVTRADFVAIGKGTAKSGTKIKKAKSGTKVKKAMMGAMASPMMDKPMMKKGGSMKKCKYGCK
jgi:hypothetical protein